MEGTEGAVQGIVEAIGVVVPGKAAIPDEASPGTVGREGPSATGAVVGMACKLLAGSGGGGPGALAVAACTSTSFCSSRSAPPPRALTEAAGALNIDVARPGPLTGTGGGGPAGGMPAGASSPVLSGLGTLSGDVVVEGAVVAGAALAFALALARLPPLLLLERAGPFGGIWLRDARHHQGKGARHTHRPLELEPQSLFGKELMQLVQTALYAVWHW